MNEERPTQGKGIVHRQCIVCGHPHPFHLAIDDGHRTVYTSKECDGRVSYYYHDRPLTGAPANKFKMKCEFCNDRTVHQVFRGLYSEKQGRYKKLQCGKCNYERIVCREDRDG